MRMKNKVHVKKRALRCIAGLLTRAGSRLLCLALLLCILPGGHFSAGQTAGAQEEETADAGTVSAQEEETAGAGTASAQEEENETDGSDVLPGKYDCRDIGKAPVVRSQGKLGTCWAISACSALEAYFLPEQQMLFSPDHLSLNNGFVISQMEGGDYRMIMAYLSGWRGPVFESEDPYGDGRTTFDLLPAVHVQEIRMLDNCPREKMKQMIRTFGPVQTSLRMTRRMTARAGGYYNDETYAFYDPAGGPVSHDILILGWDDAFPKENFTVNPGTDGAWICQNTWGEDFGSDGIFYVSYQDKNCAKAGLVYTVVEDEDNYDNLYQNDVCGWQAKLGYDTESAWFANVYTASFEETLRAAGFYTTGEETEYELWIVHDFSGEDSLEERVKIGSGRIRGMGYFTVPVTEETFLTEGERFAVAVYITTRGAKKPVAGEIVKDSFTANVRLDNREGYISQDGILWDETESVYNANICLKAYTDDVL